MKPRPPDILHFLLGIAITLGICGYQFGLSNHTVYLIDALRQINPQLLQNDWWATSTFQHHTVFTHLTAALMRWGITQPAFFLGYLTLVFLLHLAWWRITLLLGAGRHVYLLSVILFYFLAGGLGLGMYQFLQDSSFLPSNIANIAMLWGIYFWLAGRNAYAGAALGLASLFHLNHAIVACMFWFLMALVRPRQRRLDIPWQVGSLLLGVLALPTILPAVQAITHSSGAMSLPEFVALYARLRHPHHYYPPSWGILPWLAFLLPIPAAFLWHGCPRPCGMGEAPMTQAKDAQRDAALIFIFFLTLLLIATLFAGIWFVSESLIQMSLYRFSIYAKLLTCIAAAAWLVHKLKSRPKAPHLTTYIAAAALLAPAILHRGQGLLVRHLPADDPDYISLCTWVRHNTPPDSTFLVPPSEQSFRLYAQRAIVVNFKAVPQLSSELRNWRTRLEDVLDTPDITRFAGRFDHTLKLIEQRYESLPPPYLAAIAEEYEPTYIVVGHPVHEPGWRLLHKSGRYHLYFQFPPLVQGRAVIRKPTRHLSSL